MRKTQMIPLFPLDVVLFPGMVLPLHIFEPRYQQMVRDCLVTGQSFGMVWSDGDSLKVGLDKPLVGTKAMITSVEPLSEGRFNISAIGGERFRVLGFSDQQPYLVARVEPYPSLEADSPEARRYMAPLTHLFTDYLELLSQVAEQDIYLEEVPDDPATLAFVVAILYQSQNWRKQELLATEVIPDLMRNEIRLLEIENPLLQQMIDLRDMNMLPSLIAGSSAMYGLN